MIKKIIRTPNINWPARFQRNLNTAHDERLKHYYACTLPQPNTPLAEITFLAMDFETTGLDSNQDDIISIGTVPFTLNRIFIKQARHWTVRPQRQLAEDSVVIHGITHSDVLDAPDLEEIFEQVLEQMANKIVVVHYERIERVFFNRALLNRIQEGIEFPVVDTMQIETNIQKRLSSGIINTLRGKKPESVRLGRSRMRYGLPQYTPHHALTDAIASAELLQAQIAHHYNHQQPIDQLWL